MDKRRPLQRERATRPAEPHRNFDPRRVGELECDAWVAYYRREWLRFLRSAVGIHAPHLRAALAGDAPRCGARTAGQPAVGAVPGNDPDGARRAMERFYRMVGRRYHEPFDPVHASELEVGWWRVHRMHQHAGGDDDRRPLIDALAALYAYVYGVAEADVRRPAEQRALAMDHSDRWVREGCDPASPLIAQERAALVRAYAAPLAAVHR